ncbi:XRE family transcriptional regulator [soil metagenome]|jgi:DNA-binding transcriptional regulator YiaG|nr:XRE family transcriptional regulator [Gemmatimonadota bacterium]
MVGHRKWSDLKSKLPPEVREAAARQTAAMLAAMELNELRQARGLTQEELAERLGTRQPNVSRLERRLDMHISTLREVVEAMGGELVITARFPDTEIRIDQFDGTTAGTG